MDEYLEDLKTRLRNFADERDWDQFHAPKNLVMALSVEAAELVEHFQWLSEQQSHELPADKLQEVAYEMADIFIYLMRRSSGIASETAVGSPQAISEGARP